MHSSLKIDHYNTLLSYYCTYQPLKNSIIIILSIWLTGMPLQLQSGYMMSTNTYWLNLPCTAIIELFIFALEQLQKLSIQ